MSVIESTGLDPGQVVVGTAAGPGLWIAPEGTREPADFGAYTAPWRPLGYASADGVTVGGDTTTEAITPWQSTMPIRTLITGRTKTLNFTLWQLNQDTLGLYFDTEVPAATDGEYGFDVRSDTPARTYAVSVDVADGDNRFRATYRRATLESTGDMAITKGAVVPLEVTLSALDDQSVMVHIDVAAAGQAVEASFSAA